MKKKKSQVVLLPHGAKMDKETGNVEIPLGNTMLKVPSVQIGELADLLDDIATVIESNTKSVSIECPTCGNTVESIEYNEPQEGDYS